MTLNQIVGNVSKETGVTKKQAKAIIASFTGNIVTLLSTGDQILLPNLCRFTSVSRKERYGSNPSTGDKVVIPAKRVPTISYVTAVKEAVALLPLNADPVINKNSETEAE